MRILVLAAHPDDEVLGCGGSIAKWAKEGNEVFVTIMAEGSTSRDKTRDRDARKVDLSHLSKSAKKAGKIFGVKSVELLDYPDNRMDSVDMLDVVKSIEVGVALDAYPYKVPIMILEKNKFIFTTLYINLHFGWRKF